MKQSINNLKKQEEEKKAKFINEIVENVKIDFENRRKERLQYERQWELNINFLCGNQYCYVNKRGEIFDEDSDFSWQNKGVFNHIAPIIETRLAKFYRVTPVIAIRPKSDDDKDVTDATIAEKLLDSAFKNIQIENVVKQVSNWAEVCGTAFYKVVWDNFGGNSLGTVDGKEVFEGEVKVVAVSPFEIYPDNLYKEELTECDSIIHAKVVRVDEIKRLYGVDVVGEEIDVFGSSESGNLGLNKNYSSRKISNAQIVIEKYEKPTVEFPNGRLITVAGDKLLYYGELPYKNGKNQSRIYPFIKQVSVNVSGSFFGSSIIERLIPVQRAYNAVKNRKHEFLNRLSMGVLSVEDGSIDVDDLADEGLSPGKILVYRQGSKAPEIMESNSLPPDFNDEEEKLLSEFVIISGVSEVSSSSQNAKVSSGSALEILISQDNERMTFVAEGIRQNYLLLAKQILRLYSQFISGVKAIKVLTEFNRTKILYADNKSATSDDVYLESENELLYTPSQKKEMIFKLYNSGLLLDEDGILRPSTKEKVLALLGYKELDYQKGLARLHEEKAQAENEKIKSKLVEVDEVDDHSIHADEHVRYFLSEYENLTDKQKENLFYHVKEHKQRIIPLKEKVL
ncbi:MAG: hypothetical protein IKW33_01620 [Clostridia bacterium]|nr:hypothetical protein [Clostridia bacterium]